ncbi:MAG: DUF998 domain-containing protein [Ignavibacteriae bacterium]|nr:DUF998 domain-containing protein [Ignavibacteriota bacterium]
MKINAKPILLSTGIIAILFYVLHVILGGFLWKGYSHLQQPISDLTSTGAPNRDLMFLFTNIYSGFVLIFAFTFTFYEGKKHHKFVFWGSISFIVLHLISILYTFFPQDLPGNGTTFLGSMHIVVTGLIVPFTIGAPLLIGLGFIKEKKWKSFGIFSVVISIAIFIFGGMSGVFFVNKLPYFGIVERINIGFLQIWTCCLSYKLISQK